MNLEHHNVKNIIDHLKRDSDFASFISKGLSGCFTRDDFWTKCFISKSISEILDNNLIDLLLSVTDMRSIKYVALMKSSEHVTSLEGENTFHSPHIDSRPADKVLIVLEGSGSYQIFSHSAKKNSPFYIIELYLRRFTCVSFSFVLKRLPNLRNLITHSLSNYLSKSAKEIKYYDVVGEVIKFDTFSPHWSHPHPMKNSLLLQIVGNFND